MNTKHLVILVGSFALAACGSNPKPDTTPDDVAADGRAADLRAAEVAAYDRAKPVFDKFCSGCHQEGGAEATAKKMGHFDMTTYPFGGHHAMEIAKEIRTVLGIDGSEPTMPFDDVGAVQGDDLALIAAWADAFDAAHAGGAHEGMAHDHDHAH